MATSGKKNVTLHRISGPNNDIKGIYAVEVTEFVQDGVKDFITEVIRYENADDLEGTYIGKYSENGTLEIYDGNETEEQYISTLDYAMTQSAVTITPTDMTADERVRYNIRTGNRNIDEVPLSAEEQEASGLTADGEEPAESVATLGIQEGLNVNIEGRNFRKTYGDYCYPLAMKNSKQDRIKISMKYSLGSRVSTEVTNLNDTTYTTNRVFERREERIMGSVMLPIQSGIKDQNSVRWNGSSLNALQAFGAGAAMRIFNAAGGGNPIEDSGQALESIGRDARNALSGAAGDDTRTAINVYLAQQAVGTQRLLSRTAGAILNPNVEMLFDAPSLRPFTFQFRMSPRGEEEAKQVRSIINFFKQGMSVKTTNSNIFLKAPNLFDIRYITYNDNGTEVDHHPSINRIKTCALLAASVDYTPDNTYMTYDDPKRSMTSYGLTLSFNELDPIYEDDYLKSTSDGGLGMTNSTDPAKEIGY